MALEPFDPDRMARRILGMGDVVALVEEVRRNVDQEEAERLAKKVAKGKGFDFNDLKCTTSAAAEDGRHGLHAGQAAGRRGRGAQDGPGAG